MPRLGIITCQILELEFSHILTSDQDVSEIWVLNDEYSGELIKALHRDGRKPFQRIHSFGATDLLKTDDLSILIRVMEVGLHARISVLKSGVTAAVAEIAPHVDAVLLGYGLCGNAFLNVNDLFRDIPVPVMLPMDAEGPVDDCVGLIIGGRETYYAEQCLCAGTMFMNAGFSRYWKKILSLDVPDRQVHEKERILKRLMENYQRSLLLPTMVMDEIALRENTQEFNETYNLKVESRTGTLALLEKAWKVAKIGCNPNFGSV